MIKATGVSQCLDRKLKFLGFEIPDLLFILGILSVLNFVLGEMPGSFFFVWLPTLLIALVLRIGKHGKPDNFLLHQIRFLAAPKVIHAFLDSKQFKVTPNYFRKDNA